MQLRWIIAVVGLVGSCASLLRADEPAVDFQRDIVPIFEQHCYQCHDGRKQTAGLRLDIRSRAMKGGDSGDAAIVPGKSAESSLLERITTDDADLVMPPKDKGRRLSPEQIALVRSWINAGAVWPDGAAHEERLPKNHWAFNAPKRPELPAVQNAAWVRTPIDQFVLAKLEAQGLKPSPEAERATLLRRMSLDLIGLPPTIEELDAVMGESIGNARLGETRPRDEAAVERLLASPHYGECWGRHWLDAARYADSDGFEKDKPRQVWFYRDWVINVLNRDLPYDQFIVEQIAGDQLPGATQDQHVATGFLRNSMINEEGGIDPEQFRMEALFDRMETIGKSVLGITIQCAQCHNHKYDPLAQEDYYRMFAFLNDSHEANMAVYTPAEEARRAEMLRKIAEIETELKREMPDWREQMGVWEEGIEGDQPEWTIVRPEIDDISTGGQKYLPMDDGSFLAQGYAPTKHRVKLTVRTDGRPVSAFRLELLTDANLPLGGPGRSVSGVAALSEFEVEAAPASATSKPQKIKLASATADVNPPEAPLAAIYDDRSGRKRMTGPAKFAADGDPATAWVTDSGPGRRNQPRKAVFVLEKPIGHDGGTVFTIHLNQSHGGWNSDDNQSQNLGRIRLSTTAAPRAVADLLPTEVRSILEIPAEQRTPHQADAVFTYWRTTVPQWKDANERIEKLWQAHPAGSTQLVLKERAKPRQSYLLARGDFLKPEQAVSPGTPSFLHTLPDDASPTRLTFARWLVDRRSPTAARAVVNRVWQEYFGIGLVSSSEDLGIRSEAPSHPELLDWLAVELMDHGWSLKHLHRLIVNSATYRQSSRMSPELQSRDPENRLLARGPRIRVEGEQVRDIGLAASGLLNRHVGGPSVYPPIPEFLLKPPVSFGPKSWPTSTGADRYRRGLYTFRFRSVPYPMLQTFDAPSAECSCVRRPRSNTPLQALVTLNEPMSMDCAQALARLTLESGGASNESRLAYAFRRCVARLPTNGESKELLEFYENQKRRLAEGWLNSWQLATSGGNEVKSPQTPAGSTPAELAAWTCVARVLLNLDETITKE